MGHQTNNTKKLNKIHWTQILKLPTHGKKFQKMNSGKFQFKSLQIHAGAAVNPRDGVMNPKKVRAEKLDANPLSQGAKHRAPAWHKLQLCRLILLAFLGTVTMAAQGGRGRAE